MKKLLALALCFCMLLSISPLAAFAQENELIITVANDLHFNSNDTKAVKRNSLDADFAHISSACRLTNESEAIITAFFEKAGENESDILILPGDFSEKGSEKENLAFAALLADFEAKYGKQVYVTPGNHDVYNTSVEKFKEIYAQFGYDEALETDSKSGSYTVDLEGNYRLIAIDSCIPGDGHHGFDDERIAWITAQGEKAKEDGKKLIAFMHHNLIAHYILGEKIHSGGIVSSEVDYAAAFAKAGIKYTFTGHTHDHDIEAYTAADGTVIYDIITGTLTANNCPYRVVSFGDKVSFETRSIDKIDVSLLPEGISENALALAESDFPAYSKRATDISYRVLFNSYTSAKYLKSLLKVDDEEMSTIIDSVAEKLSEAINMPLEKADEVQAGKSIEALVEKYNTTIPDTDYKDMVDLAIAVYQAHNIGDENIPAYSDEIVIVTRALAAAISYALEDVSSEDYAKVLSFLVSNAGFNLPLDLLTYAGSSIKRFEGAEIIITTAILPAIVEYTVDSAPADNNVVLPGYAELVEPEEELTFWEKIAAFFKKIFDFIFTIFAFYPSK